MARGGVRDGAGRKPGYESVLRKAGYPTKVARIPEHWNVVDIDGGLEYFLSLICQYEEEIQESADNSKKGKASNRYWKLQDALKQLRAAFPRTYFPNERFKCPPKKTEVPG